MRTSLSLFCVLAFSSASVMAADNAPPPFTGPNYSGVYECAGHDSHDGDFKATMTLTLNKQNSFGNYGGYTFLMKDAHNTTYRGSAAANGNIVAITFANDDTTTKDFGTGIAKVSDDKNGGFKFEKFYYEPEYKGGGNGVETCTKAG